MKNILKYIWFVFVMRTSFFFPECQFTMRVRGWLTRPSFKRCGKNFQIASTASIIRPENVEICDDVYIAHGVWIQGSGGVLLSDEVMLGPYTVISSENHTKINGSYRWGKGEKKMIILGEGSWTGAGVKVLAGVEVGKGVLCAAGSVLTKSVVDGAIVAGIPAKVINDK